MPHKDPEAHKKAKKEWYRRNKERALENQRKYRARKAEESGTPVNRQLPRTPEGAIITRKWQNIRERVKKKGGDIDRFFLYDLYLKTGGTCQVTGIPFRIDANRTRDPFYPSLDRIDSSVGYYKDNVQFVCTIYNIAKQEWTHEDVLILANSLASDDLPW
jgi:hypothetical protein